MASNSHFEALNRDTILRCRYWNLVSCGHEDKEKRASPKLAVPKSKITASHSSDAQNLVGLPNECTFENEDKRTNCSSRLDPEALCQIVSVSANDSTDFSGHGLLFGRKEIEHIVECFKHVLDECSSDSSSNVLDASASEILTPSFDMAARMAQGDEVQRAILKQARANFDSVREVGDFGEEIEELSAPTDLSHQQRSSVGRNQNVNGYDCGTAPLHIRFVRAIGRLFKKPGKRGSQAIELIVDKITACFNVARPIVGKTFRAIKIGLLWIVRAIVDPQGEIREILDDPERSKCVKAIEVTGVVAVATIGALIMSFGAAGTGPFGVGAATVGVAAASAAVRRQPLVGGSL